MSEDPSGLEPEEGLPGRDASLDVAIDRWVMHTTDAIDVEAALARVTARRIEESPTPVDELATRRAARRVPVAPVPLWQRSGLRAAAALVMIAGAAALWRIASPSAAAQSYVTETGTAQGLRLGDGTVVRLGPASSMTLEPGFGESHRRLTLRGEAWFQVAHDATRPFAITVGAVTIEDVGTAFLVRESAASAVTVRVSEGAVRLTSRAAARDSTVMLRAGDGAVATAIGIDVAPGVVTPAEGNALAAGRLTFTDASLTEVQDALRRWYGMSLIVGDSTLRTRHVTADVTGESAARIATILGLTLGVTTDVHGDTIELHASTMGMPTRP